MGQTFSANLIRNGEPASSTPQRTPICTDPRSPTKDIDRTPIQVGPPIANDENNSPGHSATKEDKSRKQSLRQRMFERKKNKKASADE